MQVIYHCNLAVRVLSPYHFIERDGFADNKVESKIVSIYGNAIGLLRDDVSALHRMHGQCTYSSLHTLYLSATLSGMYVKRQIF